MSEIKPLKTFVIYAQEDYEHKEALLTSLNPLIRKKKIEIWHDEDIIAGDNWEQTILSELNSSEVIIILLTPHSLESDFIFNALEVAVKKGSIDKAIILPILVVYCPWREVDILSKIQMVPVHKGTGLKPIIDKIWQEGEAWTVVVDEVNKLIDSRQVKKSRKIFQNPNLINKKNDIKFWINIILIGVTFFTILSIIIYDVFWKVDFEKEYELVSVIGSGSFMMGNTYAELIKGDEDEYKHEVYAPTFKLGKYEVTQKQWRYIMGYNNSSNRGCRNCPVDNVSWKECQVFIKKLNKTSKSIKYRLPTEIEWEYAAKGGENKLYAGSNDLNSVGWYLHNSDGKTHPIGQRMPNKLGIYDLSGNVREWCLDDYTPYPNSVGGDKEGKINRGGSATEDVNAARCSFRGRAKSNSTNFEDKLLGLRLAANL